MNDTLTTARQTLIEEAKRLRDEAARAEKAAAGLSNGAAPQRTVKRAKSQKKDTKRGRPKGSGARGKQALEVITAKPGITINALATEMGIKPNYLYRVVPTLPVTKTKEGGLVPKS